MANPNRTGWAYKNSPWVKQGSQSFNSIPEAEKFAAEKKAEGFKIKQTSERVGSFKNPYRIHNVFWYAKRFG